MNWFKIARYLLIAEIVIVTFIVLYILKIALAQSIGIGVMPAILKFNFPGVYEREFCFFNKGSMDAIYSIQSGDIKVLTEINFTVHANTDINTCVKKRISFVADKTGYFYISAFPEEMPEGAVQLIRMIGVKIEVLSSTTTTVQQSVSSGTGGAISGTSGAVSEASNETSESIFEGNLTTVTTTTIQNISIPQSEYNASADISTQEASETSDLQNYSNIIKVVIMTIIVVVSFYILLELLALK